MSLQSLQQDKTGQKKINGFYWTHQRSEITGQIATLESGETDSSQVTAKKC